MAISVKIGRVPGTVNEVNLNDGATVSDAMEVANIEQDNTFSISVNSDPGDGHTVLRDGDKVLLTKEVKGNA